MNDSINWQKVLTELHDCMTMTALSAKTGIKLSTLTDLKAGRSVEPQYGAGYRIINVYKREMARIARQTPKEKQA